MLLWKCKHLKGDGTKAIEGDVQENPTKSGNLPFLPTDKGIEDTYVVFEGNLCEKEHGRPNILESKADIVAGLVEALRVSGSSEGIRGNFRVRGTVSQGELMTQRKIGEPTEGPHPLPR